MHRTLKNNIKQTLCVVNFHRRYCGVSMFMFMRPPKTRYIYFTIKDKTSWFTRRSCNQQHQRINRIINHIFVHLMTKSQQDQIIWKVLKKPQQVPNLPNMQHGCRTRSISDPTRGRGSISSLSGHGENAWKYRQFDSIGNIWISLDILDHWQLMNCFDSA